MKTILLILFIALFPAGVHAQSIADDLVRFSNHGEVYFKIHMDGDFYPSGLPSWISADRLTGDGYLTAYARRDHLAVWIQQEDVRGIELLPHPSTLIHPLMKEDVCFQSTENWDFYPTYEAYVEGMYQFEANYPGLCQVFSIGQSVEGREILMAVVSNSEQGSGHKPQFLYTATIHGDETAGYVLFLRLIDFLLDNYDSDPGVKTLVDNLEIWINPLANPDGTFASGNNTVFGATRFNANGIDLNRNYPDPEDGDHPDGFDWQDETMHFMTLAQDNHFVMAANCHGGSEVFNYPWDTWAQLPADDQWWNFVGREWVDTVHTYGPPGYFDGFDNGVSNGYQWYTISGGRQDFMNYFHHCREFTLEISNTKLLPANLLPAFWEYNHRSFLNYMHQALYGISGRVLDAATGEPLRASVFIEMHDADESWVATNEEGWFFRPVFEGVYNLEFYTPGYELLKIENVQATNYSLTSLEVELVYTGSGTDAIRLNDLFSIGGNPGSGIFSLVYSGKTPIQTEVQVHDAEGRICFESNCAFTSGNQFYMIDIKQYKSGIYFLRLNAGLHSGTFKLVKN